MKPKHFMKSAVIVLLALMNQLSFAQQQTKITCTTSVPFQPQSAVIATDPIGQSGCEGTDLFFFVETTGDAPITYQWQLFNGAAWVNISNVGAYSGTDADTFRITGLQTAFGGNNYRCVISNGCGDDTSSAGVLTVNPLPVANAGADASIVMGETASLTGIAANYTSILWSSTGDGNFSLPGNLSTTYSPGPSDSIAGEVMLVLQATSSCGVSTDTIVLTITQLQIDCHAEFTAEYSGGNTVLLTNSSTGDLGMMFWDFGDGVFMNETQQSFSHSYTNPGFYTICLTTFDSITNCQDDTCISIEIDSLVPNCSAIFQFTNLAGNAIAFDGSQSQGSLTSYQWEFGDGSVSFAISPTHSFPASGYYNVTLVVYDSINNCMSQYERVVAAGSPANDCAAEFTYYSELTNKTVHFVSVSQGQNVDQVLWNFGDGSFATQPDTSHIFQTSAFYNVCLSVLSSTTGCANITCRTIKVGDDDHSCHASFVYAVDSTYSKSASGRKVDFKGTAFGDPAKSVWSILWNFGDGETDTTTLTPSHVYADTGLYQVSLKISSTYCADLYYGLVNAGSWLNQIRGAFIYTIDTLSKSEQYPADFKGAAFGDPAVISWDFGDGGMDSTTFFPSYTYADPGDYNVCFTVADPNTGQSDTYCDSVHIEEIVFVNISNRAGLSAEVHPNPVASRAMIGYYLPKATTVNVSITDTYGRTVQVLSDKSYSAGNHTIFWDVENLNPGIYLVTIKTEGGFISKRVVVAK